MNRSRILFFLVSALLVLFIVGGNMLGAVGKDGGEDSLYKYLSVFTEVLGLVRQAYVEEVELPELMAGAMDAATEAMDPFSLYLPAEELDRFLAAREASVRLTGMTVLKERGVAFVAALEPGSPADEAGVELSDIVAEINGRETRLIPPWEILEILGGAPGTTVELDLIRFGERETVQLELASFTPPAAGLERVEGAGMIRVGGFRPRAAAGVREALEEASRQSMDRLLLDLRGIAGGDPAVAYEIAGLFVSGELGALDRRGEALETFESEAPPLWRGRLVVLTSRGTLGPAEILASVLQQRAGAELVGERTFGHAGRQAVAELRSGGRLVYTDAFYTGPDGEPLRESLEPDLRVNSVSRTYDERDLPFNELILKRALERLREADGETLQKAA